MKRPYLISAIGTPLDDQERLHKEGLIQHLDEQSDANMDGILVAGTMGLLQLLSDQTYYDLISLSARHWNGKGEVLAGVGDTSYARTHERIRMISDAPVDGIVVLSPYFIAFSQAELVDYFRALADTSRVPLFLYDLPQRTRTSLEIDTVLTLAQHPNIVGIKCSGDIDQTRRLLKLVEGTPFRVIVSQVQIIDDLVREGVGEQLDGLFSIVPHHARLIADTARNGETNVTQPSLDELNRTLKCLQHYGVFPGMTAILNARGIQGNFAPKPFHSLSDAQRDRLLAELRC